jgi:hypothetical protein
MEIHICDKCDSDIEPYDPNEKAGTAYVYDGYGGTYKIELCKNCQKDFIKWLIGGDTKNADN